MIVPDVPVEAQQLPRARELAYALDGVPIRRSERHACQPNGRTERASWFIVRGPEARSRRTGTSIVYSPSK